MPKRAVFEKSRREISLDVSVGVSILLVVEQSSLESQSRGCAKTPILTVVLALGCKFIRVFVSEKRTMNAVRAFAWRGPCVIRTE